MRTVHADEYDQLLVDRVTANVIRGILEGWETDVREMLNMLDDIKDELEEDYKLQLK